MARPCAGAPKRCLDLARLVRATDSAEAAGANGLTSQLYSFGHFRPWRIDSAVAFPIAEIKDEANQEPNDQSHPVGSAKPVNHCAAHDNSEDGYKRRRGDAEATFGVRTFHTHDPDTDAHENEREECSNAGHLTGD